MIVILLDIVGAAALAYAGLLMAVYTGRPWLCGSTAAALMGTMIYLSF